jgi:penicillin amidase
MYGRREPASPNWQQAIQLLFYIYPYIQSPSTLRMQTSLLPFSSLLKIRWCLAIFLLLLLNCRSSSQVPAAEIRLAARGLTEGVEVLRDPWGVNHIYARNKHDLFFAQGYLAARDRLFQFECWRRRATGTVSEILGPAELKRDIGARLFKYRGDLKREFAHYHPEGVQIIQSFVDGVNAYVDEVNRQPEKLPLEFRILGFKPGRWSPEVVISRHQGLLQNVTEELNTGRAVRISGADLVKKLVWFHPKDPNLDIDPTITRDMLAEDILSPYTAFKKPLSFGPADATIAYAEPLPSANADAAGSNNWVVSGTKTASGKPILANDPHRTVTSPSLRYMVHLSAPGWDVIGGGEPVIPGVSIGHNADGAWGLTIFETDSEDLYVYELNPSNARQYRHKGKWLEMETVQEKIPIRQGDSVSAVLHYTIHGPVTLIDSARNRAYAVRCAWLEPGGAPYLASLRMNQARNWNEFREACSYSHIPGENMVWADRTGNIGWQVVGIAPVRNHFSGLVPIPGDGRFEWDGYLPIKERPHEHNTSRGFIATANQHVTPPEYPHWNSIGYRWADPFRGNRIRGVLDTSKRITIAQTRTLQTDYFSIPASILVPMLQTVELPSAMDKEAKALLLQWDFRLEKNSVAAGIYAMWERILSAEANKRFVPVALKGLISPQLSRIIEWLQQPQMIFGDDAAAERDRFLAMTFSWAVSELNRKFGMTVSNWRYGQPGYKQVSFQHPLHAYLDPAQKKQYGMGPLPRGGNSHTPNATGSTDLQTFGASFRLIVDLSDWDQSLMINTPGQSEDPGSPFYKNLFETWSEDGYFPALYTREKIQQSSVQKTVLVPEH